MHKGLTGPMNNSVIIIGGVIGKLEERDLHKGTVCIFLEPKSSQSLAMKTIFDNQTILPWKQLPKKLIRRFMDTAPEEHTDG